MAQTRKTVIDQKVRPGRRHASVSPELAHRFAIEYAKDYNGTQAYIRVRPSMKPDTARALASRLLANDHVQALIDVQRRRQIQELEMSAVNALALVWEAAAFDPMEMLDDDGNLLPLRKMSARARRCIEGMEVARANLDRTDGKRSTEFLVKTKLVSKSKMRELVGKHYKLWDRGSEIDATDIERFTARINRARQKLAELQKHKKKGG